MYIDAQFVDKQALLCSKTRYQKGAVKDGRFKCLLSVSRKENTQWILDTDTNFAQLLQHFWNCLL